MRVSPLLLVDAGARSSTLAMAPVRNGLVARTTHTSYRVVPQVGRKFRVEVTEPGLPSYFVGTFRSMVSTQTWILRDAELKHAGRHWQRFAARYAGGLPTDGHERYRA